MVVVALDLLKALLPPLTTIRGAVNPLRHPTLSPGDHDWDQHRGFFVREKKDWRDKSLNTHLIVFLHRLLTLPGRYIHAGTGFFSVFCSAGVYVFFLLRLCEKNIKLNCAAMVAAHN